VETHIAVAFARGKGGLYQNTDPSRRWAKNNHAILTHKKKPTFKEKIFLTRTIK
jgi:hypothetical protein